MISHELHYFSQYLQCSFYTSMDSRYVYMRIFLSSDYDFTLVPFNDIYTTWTFNQLNI